MKIEMTQDELAAIHDNGEVVLNFRTASQVAFANGAGFYLKPIRRTHGLPYVGRGRFMVVSEDKFHELDAL